MLKFPAASVVTELTPEKPFAFQPFRKSVDFLGLEADRSVHVVGIAEHQVGDAALTDHPAQLRPARGFVRIGQRRQRGGDPEVVAVGEADAFRAVVDAEAAHAL